MKLASLVAVAFAAAGMSACQTDPDYQAEVLQSEAASDEDMVCERVRITGTRFFREVCMSGAEAERTAQEARQTAADIRRRSDIQPNSPSAPN